MIIKKHLTIILAALFIAVSFSFSFAAMLGDSGTTDEIAHIPAGYTYLKYHDYRLNPEHPPLLKEIAAIPLLFQKLNFNTNLRDYKELANGQWESGWDFIYRAGNNPDQILFWSRLPILLLFVAFGLSLFFIVKKYYGAKIALFSLFLFSFSPTLAGHNHYVTTDLGAAFFIFLSIYFFLNFLKNPTERNVVWAGVFLGLAQLSKFSAALLFPLFIILVTLKIFSPEAKTRGKRAVFLNKLSIYAGGFILSTIICYILVGVLYALTMYAMPEGKIQQLIVASLPGENVAFFRNFLLSIHNIPVLKYYTQYLIGLFMVFGRVGGGNTTFLLGQVTNQSFFWYFPVAFVTKEMLGFLILFFFTIVAVFWKNISYGLKIKQAKNKIRTLFKNFWNFFEKNLLHFAMLVFIFIYMVVTLKGNLNIGIRHLLPILPMIYILVACWTVEWTGHSSFRTAFVGLLSFWILASYILVYPKYLAYFNEIAGGTNNGYKILTDSNLDWGQDLKRLAGWVEKKGIDKIKVDYFGGSVPEYYLGKRYQKWTSHYGPTTGWIAVSATYLQNSRWYHLTSGEPDYDWLRERTPVAIIGGSILVYYVE